jgi:hypothetical protein
MADAYNRIQLSSILDQLFWRIRVVEVHLAQVRNQLETQQQEAASMTPAEVVELRRRRDLATAGPHRDVPATS